jgi:ABC-2 type transport system permease protein
MTGLGAFLGKEAREIVRTWRIWVLPGIVLFFALTGPPLARFTKELLAAALGSQAEGLPLPTPTYLDSYAQWTKNLGQLVMFALILMLGGAVSGEHRAGTTTLVLTKPLSRASFIVAKVLANIGLVVVTTLVGAAVTWVGTRLFFPEAPPGPLLAATASWLLVATLFVGITVFASAAVDASAGAVGIAFAVYVVLAVGGVWAPTKRYTPAGLLGAPDQLAHGGHPALVWPVLTCAVLTVAIVWAAIAVFRRREL